VSPSPDSKDVANGSSENPPPKVVQGYKFNIFYPDLMYVPLYH
jgi:hypothetical protein